MISRLALVAMSLLVAFGALAATTNELSDAEIAGRNLVRQILEMRPTENLTNTGVLKIRPKKAKQIETPVTFKVVVTPTNWVSVYETTLTNTPRVLIVRHTPDQPNEFFYRTNSVTGIPIFGDVPIISHLTRSHQLSGVEIMTPFAGSDFWLADLGLEFFHWPQQKILKKEFRNNCACMVLESVNPNPTTNGYSRVVTWIDEESLGVVQAEAYDSQNKKLKEFYPKGIKKVNGQWQVQTMQIINVQTDSRTRIEFHLESH